MASSDKKIYRLLAFRLSAMGDVAMTVPVVSSLLRQNPELHLTLLTNARFAPMFHGIDRLDIVGVDTKGKHSGLLGMFKLFRQVRREVKFDAFADLHDVIRAKELRLMMRLTGVPVAKIDKGRKQKDALVRDEDKQLVQLKTSVERYADVFRSLGLKVDVDFKSLFADGCQFELPIRAKTCKWIGIAPFAQHNGKIYPLDKMKLVVEKLQASGAEVLLFGGGKQEKEILESWESQFQNVISLAGKFDLLTELKIISQCDVLVSMDSANMHLASLVNTPVVSVWGATHPYAGFYGYGQDIKNAVQLNLPCRPCSIYGNLPCRRGNYDCLAGIKPDDVVDRVEAVLAR